MDGDLDIEGTSELLLGRGVEHTGLTHVSAVRISCEDKGLDRYIPSSKSSPASN